MRFRVSQPDSQQECLGNAPANDVSVDWTLTTLSSSHSAFLASVAIEVQKLRASESLFDI